MLFRMWIIHNSELSEVNSKPLRGYLLKADSFGVFAFQRDMAKHRIFEWQVSCNSKCGVEEYGNLFHKQKGWLEKEGKSSVSATFTDKRSWKH